MPVRATIKNDTALLRKLQIIPAAMHGKIREALAAQADEIVAMMRRLVPVESGSLRDSIGWTWGTKAPGGSIAVAEAGAKGDPDLRITIFAGNNEAFYARWVEFGTVKMPARPFFYVSWRAGKKTAKTKVRAAVRAAAREVAAR